MDLQLGLVVFFVKSMNVLIFLGVSALVIPILAFASPADIGIDGSKALLLRDPIQMVPIVRGPDLTVESAQVMGPPLKGLGAVLMPLEIKIKNIGTSAVTEDFNVGAEGWATDGNVYGFDFFVTGETTHERGGVSVGGLAAGAERTYQGMLLMAPTPLGSEMNSGSRYEIHAMVDYNLDPDAGYYEWGVRETNKTNNALVIYYPLTFMRPISIGQLSILNP
ncbi:hypothetical protein [Candidatus Methanocrinis natronophilus]|uniref:DUF4352 domain-containing protein n=1 Tax=Candidatus Methanocrinis natronophilus TaxID=3033396 RepID=A0ABT5X5U5_9EURY|nr:hypothetical protein [Candidatus Methanocrinis natronophilus]MDF0590071.1 hypothetical protein [Candidatus Methanocrinis natronophilus]